MQKNLYLRAAVSTKTTSVRIELKFNFWFLKFYKDLNFNMSERDCFKILFKNKSSLNLIYKNLSP